jgi:hypothetical protein
LQRVVATRADVPLIAFLVGDELHRLAARRARFPDRIPRRHLGYPAAGSLAPRDARIQADWQKVAWGARAGALRLLDAGRRRVLNVGFSDDARAKPRRIEVRGRSSRPGFRMGVIGPAAAPFVDAKKS